MYIYKKNSCKILFPKYKRVLDCSLSRTNSFPQKRIVLDLLRVDTKMMLAGHAMHYDYGK